MHEPPRQRLQLLDSRQLDVGHAIVTVRVLELQRLLQAHPMALGGGGCAAARIELIEVRVSTTHITGEPMLVAVHGQQ